MLICCVVFVLFRLCFIWLLSNRCWFVVDDDSKHMTAGASVSIVDVERIVMTLIAKVLTDGVF